MLIGTALFINSGSNERKKVFDLETLESTIIIEEVSSDNDFEISFSGFGSPAITDYLQQPAEQSISKIAQQNHNSTGGQGKLYILFHQLRVHS